MEYCGFCGRDDRMPTVTLTVRHGCEYEYSVRLCEPCYSSAYGNIKYLTGLQDWYQERKGEAK